MNQTVQKWSDRAGAFIGLIGVVIIVSVKVMTYGTRWEFGPRGVPVSKLAEDGLHYSDGSAVNPLELALIQSGHEESTVLASFALYIFLATLIIRAYLMLKRSQDARDQFRAAIEKEFPELRYRANEQQSS